MTVYDQIQAARRQAMPNCDWDKCDDKGPVGITNVQLQIVGTTTIRIVPVVRLCYSHYGQMKRTGHLKLGYHPDEVRLVPE